MTAGTRASPVFAPGCINDLSARAAMGLADHYVPASLDDPRVAVAEVRALPTAELVRRAEDPETPFLTRWAAATLLALLGDPRLSVFAPPMVDVPAGTPLIGLDPARVDEVAARWRDVGVLREWIAKEAPAFRERVAPFRIGKYPVTHAEWREFLEDTAANWIPTAWPLGTYPAERANHPVHTLPAEAADAYAAWLSARTGRRFRLPTEIEWEYAAAGPQGSEFPWGNTWEPGRANTVEHGPRMTTPVGIYPLGRSWCGAMDLAGNVEEYVADDYRPYPNGTWVEDDLLRSQGAYRILRGGSFTRFADLARTRRRHGLFPKTIYVAGFRLAETL